MSQKSKRFEESKILMLDAFQVGTIHDLRYRLECALIDLAKSSKLRGLPIIPVERFGM